MVKCKLVESHTKLETRLEATASPVLQTRAPTWKTLGPTNSLLLSRPITPHDTGVMASTAAPRAGVACPASQGAHKRSTITREPSTDLIFTVLIASTRTLQRV